MAAQRVDQMDAVFHRHKIVRAGGKDKAGAGGGVHRRDHVRRTGQIVFGARAVDHWVAEDRRVGAFPAHGRGAGGQMPARGKADDRDAVACHMPLLRVGADHAHGLLIVAKRIGPPGILIERIAQDKGVIARLQIGVGDRLRLPVRAEMVAAAGDDQHGGALGERAELAAHGLEIACQRDMALFI